MKDSLIFVFTILIIPSILLGQVIKPPIAFPDSVNIWAGQTISLNILANDISQENHPVEVFFIGNNFTNLNYSDSILTVESRLYHHGTDTIKYKLRDLVNFLCCEGEVYIDIKNEAFGILDNNNLSVEFNTMGTNFWDPIASPQQLLFIAPKNSGLSPLFSSGLWVAGLDEESEIHVATDRNIGYEFLYFNGGPSVEERDSIFYSKWVKVWNANKQIIDYHRSHYFESAYTPHPSIDNWPSRADAKYGIDEGFAPFIDFNENGIYDPENGDYPKIKGDEALFYSFNNNQSPNSSYGLSLGIEVHSMPYIFECKKDSALQHTLFHNFNIQNLSDTTYYNLYIGYYLDFDLGYYLDDYVGTDTLLNSIYIYNSDNYDDTLLNGTPYGGGYDIRPPAFGITMLDHTLSSSIIYNSINYNEINGEPGYQNECYNALKGLWKDSSNITYGGNGMAGDTPTKFMFTGNPTDSSGWIEENDPNDKRGLISIGPFTFPPDSVITFELAYVFARDYQGDNLTSVALLKERIAKIREYYKNDSTPCGSSFSATDNQIIENKEFKVFPNPATNYLNISCNIYQYPEYIICDVLGNPVISGKLLNNEINIEKLSSGVYFLKFISQNDPSCIKFIKL